MADKSLSPALSLVNVPFVMAKIAYASHFLIAVALHPESHRARIV